MYIRKLTINGFKNFKEESEIHFSKGLSVLVGENGSGKSAIIDAIRLVLQEDMFGRRGISSDDFHRPFCEDGKPAEGFRIRIEFANLDKQEKIVFLPWLTDLGEGLASLTLETENRQNNRGRYKYHLWGGRSRNNVLEKELLDTVICIYMPPLRDAEAKLREGRGSVLARLLKRLNKEKLERSEYDGKEHPLVEKVKGFNETLEQDQDLSIALANDLIKRRLKEAVGETFGQDTIIQFSETNFNRIVESLRLLFFPKVGEFDRELFRNLEENSLGYNNLLYLATILAQLSNESQDDKEYLQLLLIEEPEAHLHPQLQVRLLKYLEKCCESNNIQVIITTHSPVLASAVSLKTIIHISKNDESPKAVRVDACGLNCQAEAYLSRWLDVTKSTLFFAKGIILVEGITEAMLLPELADRWLREYNKKYDNKLPPSLSDAGVSVINMNGIYFKYFIQLFCDLDFKGTPNIPIRCAGITDKDPPKTKNGEKYYPETKNEKGKNPALKLIKPINKSKWARLFVGDYKTFEYDLAMEAGNLNRMLEVLITLVRPDSEDSEAFEKLGREDWREMDNKQKAQAAGKLLKKIEDSKIGKGLFAQVLADKLEKNLSEPFEIPLYIKQAVTWACGGDFDEL